MVVNIQEEASNTLLIPIEELPPGSLGAIRRQVTDNLIQMVSTQLKVGPETLVARDIRPYTDLAWGTNTDFTGSAISTDIWNVTQVSSAGAFFDIVVDTSTTMADRRWVAIYGIRDMRTCFATRIIQAISLFKITVGNSTKAIWDTTKLAAYKNNPVGVSASAVIIPQNTQYQFSGYCIGSATTVCWVSLEGVIVEPRGKVISP